MSSQESYDYDDLHRLTLNAIGMVAGVPSISYSYDAVGNFAAKSDYASSYGYAANSNRVTSVQLAGGGSKSFGYDSNGNLTTENGVETIEYNAFNKPTVIRRPNVAGLPQATEIAYGADLMRYRKVTQDGTTTLYVDKLFERISSSDKVQERYYIEDIAALTVTTENGSTTPSIAFTHKDRLGSTVALVDDDGGDPLEFHSYDPFGKPRQGSGAPKSPIELASGYMTRGFTDYEHMDEVQLIHMNGRGYDYNLGRFLSVDPFIVAPGNSQALNPYAYVLNNPLSATDPTGYQMSCTGTRIQRTDCSGIAGLQGAPGRKKTETPQSNGSGAPGAVTVEEALIKAGEVRAAIEALSDQERADISQDAYDRLRKFEEDIIRELVGTQGGGSGSGSLDRVGRGVAQKRDWTEKWFRRGNHRYSHLSPEVCAASENCTHENIVKSLNKKGVHPNQARPFVPGKEYIGDVDIPGPFGADDVKSTAIYNADGVQLGVRNETLENHALHPGIVQRTVIQNSSSFHILTEGGGYGRWGGPNIWFDSEVWEAVDRAVLNDFK